MAYGKPKLSLRAGDRVKADLRNNGKMSDAEVIDDAPRISARCAGSIEWLLRVTDGAAHGQWVSEHLIEVSK